MKTKTKSFLFTLYDRRVHKQSPLQLAHPWALRSKYKQVSALTFLGSLLHLELAHKVTLHRIDIRTKETNHLANNHHRKNWLENVLAIQIKQPRSSDFGIVGCLTPQESEKFKGPLDCDALDWT